MDRLGGTRSVKVDVRFIAATTVDLRLVIRSDGSARTSSTA